MKTYSGFCRNHKILLSYDNCYLRDSALYMMLLVYGVKGDENHTWVREKTVKLSNAQMTTKLKVLPVGKGNLDWWDV